jgi:hypothetical protein
MRCLTVLGGLIVAGTIAALAGCAPSSMSPRAKTRASNPAGSSARPTRTALASLAAVPHPGFRHNGHPFHPWAGFPSLSRVEGDSPGAW